MKTRIQQRKVMPAIWRGLLSRGVEGAQPIKVLTPPSTLRGTAWTQSAQENGNSLQRAWIMDNAL